jgi:hypothetical protein
VAKNEEEEFNTGPLSVLMMSVKNNTQVCLFFLFHIYSTTCFVGLFSEHISCVVTLNIISGTDKLSQQQKASRPCQGF